MPNPVETKIKMAEKLAALNLSIVTAENEFKAWKKERQADIDSMKMRRFKLSTAIATGQGGLFEGEEI